MNAINLRLLAAAHAPLRHPLAGVAPALLERERRPAFAGGLRWCRQDGRYNPGRGDPAADVERLHQAFAVDGHGQCLAGADRAEEARGAADIEAEQADRRVEPHIAA